MHKIIKNGPSPSKISPWVSGGTQESCPILSPSNFTVFQHFQHFLKSAAQPLREKPKYDHKFIKIHRKVRLAHGWSRWTRAVTPHVWTPNLRGCGRRITWVMKASQPYGTVVCPPPDCSMLCPIARSTWNSGCGLRGPQANRKWQGFGVCCAFVTSAHWADYENSAQSLSIHNFPKKLFHIKIFISSESARKVMQGVWISPLRGMARVGCWDGLLRRTSIIWALIFAGAKCMWFCVLFNKSSFSRVTK